MNKTEQDEFRSDVEGFLSMYCEDYFKKHTVIYEVKDEISAEITLIDKEEGEVNERKVPISWDIPVSFDYDEGAAGINIGDAGFLALDGKGLFTFLWIEAKRRMDVMITLCEPLD